MRLRRVLCALFVVLVATVALSGVAVADHTIIPLSEHTTDSDFQNAETLDNLDVSGTGDSAQLELRPEPTDFGVTRPADDGSYTTTTSYGIVIETGEAPVHDPFAYWSDFTYDNNNNNNPPSRAWIEDDSGNVVAYGTVGSDGADFDGVTLDPNTKYHLLADNDDGSLVQHGAYFTISTYSSTYLDITDGSCGAGCTPDMGDQLYTFDEIDYTVNETQPATYVSATHDVTDGDGAILDTRLDGVTATVEWQGYDGTSWTTVSTATLSNMDGEHVETWTDNYDKWRVQIDYSPDTHDAEADLRSESVGVESSEPELDNASASPSGGEFVQETPVTLEINVSHGGFDQGESVEIEWYHNDVLVGTTTHTQNETASIESEEQLAGSNEWYAVASDEENHDTQSETFAYQAPDELEVRDETNPDELITDNATLRARFFVDSDDETVVEREVTNGTVSLAGLPADAQMVVTVREEQSHYSYRRIIIDSIIETQEIYLLPDDAESSRIHFQLDDNTGMFDPQTTQLFILKPITRDNETEYRVIAGDSFGADATFPVDLVTDERYRLRVANDGRQRTLGEYTTSGDAFSTLTIGRIEIESSIGEHIGFGASLIKQTDEEGTTTRHARIDYIDPAGLTDELHLSVYRIDGTNETLVTEDNITNPGLRHVGTYPLPTGDPENATYEVRYIADRDGEILEGSQRIGAVEEIAGELGVDPTLLELLGYLAILALTGLVAIVSPALATIAAVVAAALLTVMGITNIPGAAIGISGVMALMYNVARAKGVR